MEPNFTILNSNYTIKEISFGDKDNVKKIINDIKDVKNFICRRIDYKNDIKTNLDSSFIVNDIKRLKDDNRAFCFVIYQTVIMYNVQKQKPTAILIARKGSLNNTYILSLLCKYQHAIKGLGGILLQKLIEKANLNQIKYIYVESVYDSNYFYKLKNFESDSEKDLHTESESDPKLYGYILDLDKIQHNGSGGTSFDVSSNEAHIYKFTLTGDTIYKLTIENNGGIVGWMNIEDHLHPIYVYCSIEIKEVFGNTEKDKEILFTIIDSMCKHNYINKSFMYCLHENEYMMNLLRKYNYTQLKDKMKLCYFENVHNTPQYIDRTVLSIFNDLK